MGNCCSSPVDEPNRYPLEPEPAAVSPHQNPDASNASESSWQSMASSTFTSWVSQVSSSLQNIRSNETVDDILTNGGITAGENLRVFTFSQLKAATRNFSSNRVVGRGGYGKVYRGGLKERDSSERVQKLVIAVKTLDTSSRQGIKEWLAEVNILGMLSHPNLVKLLGYCLEKGKFFIVYEFVKNGSLNYHLFKKDVQPLPWETRFIIILGMARGLAYLHTLDPPIIHRDFKSSNVLLDKLYNAKISDFGLAFLGSLAGRTHVATSVLGTYGYAAPEFVNTGHLYIKSDVYSFGVVLVEMLTGLRAVDKKRPSKQRVLVNWVKPHLSNRQKLKNVMDSRLRGKYPYKEASEIAQLAIKCLHTEPQFRPSMIEVVETVEQVEASRHNRGKHKS